MEWRLDRNELDSIILYKHQLVNGIKLTKYLTKIQTKNKRNRCKREYVYKDELPLYKVNENVNQRQKKASDYFRSGGRYLDSCCNVLLSLKCILNPIEIFLNYFNSGRYFNSGCDVKLS